MQRRLFVAHAHEIATRNGWSPRFPTRVLHSHATRY
jgi:hypothetical protein